jgi:hypothetical protein
MEEIIDESTNEENVLFINEEYTNVDENILKILEESGNSDLLGVEFKLNIYDEYNNEIIIDFKLNEIIANK